MQREKHNSPVRSFRLPSVYKADGGNGFVNLGTGSGARGGYRPSAGKRRI
jgi:hypothetical protein